VATGLRKKFDDIFSRLDTMHQRDRRTDTERQQRLHLRIASHCNKIKKGFSSESFGGPMAIDNMKTKQQPKDTVLVSKITAIIL